MISSSQNAQTHTHTHTHTHLEQKLSALQVLGQDVQHPNHLREDEHAVATLLETYQQLVQQNQLTAASDQVLRVRREMPGWFINTTRISKRQQFDQIR